MKGAVLLAVSLLAIALPGCGGREADGPPVVRLGDSVCDQCNMIISDARWATATIVDGPRGGEPRLFDDFNCQVNYEREHTAQAVLARWSHSHATSEWISTESAQFLISPEIRSPMGSRMAAFGSASEAAAAESELAGEVVDFATAWARLGGTETPAGAGDASDTSIKKEPDGGP